LLDARAATFGTVVAIGGEAADIALDEARGILYVANFTAGRIDVISLADNTLKTSMHVAPGPSALALSPDHRYLVAVHFGNVPPPGASSNAVSILDLSAGVRQSLALTDPPLGVAFGADGLALIATTTTFLLLDPSSGVTQFLNTVSHVAANSLPAAPGTPPAQIVAAAMAASADGSYIFGLTDSMRFVYETASKNLWVNGYTANPALGPRVVTASEDGSFYGAGWGVFARSGVLLNQFPNPSGQLAVGSQAIDSRAGRIYSQIPNASTTAGAAPPVLTISDSDNLTMRERLQLPENLAGRAVLNAAGSVLYSVSDSGVLVLPVGNLNQVPRLSADREDLVFRGSFCQSGPISQSFQLTDPGGGHTAFAINSSLAGVVVSPAAGRTPATILVTVNPGSFQNQRGTVSGWLNITSTEAVNLPPPVRLLVNNQRPDERGSFSDLPGSLVDLLADPVRNRFYILRQDRNQVLVFDGTSMLQIESLRTANTPTRMALSFDRKFLLVGHDNSQLAYVYDLDALAPTAPVVFPAGHYPRSIAESGGALLAASRGAGGTHTVDRIDLVSRTAATLPSLGVFQNSINQDTVLAPTPNGASIMAASADGNVLLYDAAANTFTVSRKIGTALGGAYMASGEGHFVAGSNLLNGSLTPLVSWSLTDFFSGFAFLGGQGLRLTGPQGATGAGGLIARVDLANGSALLATRVAEQPVVAPPNSAFTRTLAPLSNGQAIVALTASGFTVLSFNFDAAAGPPTIVAVVNAADGSSAVAPGALISVFGAALSPTNIATSEIPLPTALGQSCLTVNGAAIPMFFASPSQINAQLPLRLFGSVTMTLYTPGGSSDDYFLNVQPVAPAVFQSGTAGPLTGLPVVVKASNQQLVTPTNPLHSGDVITIYVNGMGATSPAVEAGLPSPFAPLAVTVATPDVRLGGAPLSVSYAGLVPGEVGVYQINAQVPAKAPEGSQVSLTIAQAGVTTSVAVRVIE
jgi:uncharacterized protein (TIGR03437 family)